MRRQLKRIYKKKSLREAEVAFMKIYEKPCFTVVGAVFIYWPVVKGIIGQRVCRNRQRDHRQVLPHSPRITTFQQLFHYRFSIGVRYQLLFFACLVLGFFSCPT